MAELVIRDEQRKPFRELALAAFEDRMFEHLFAFSPQHCRGIGAAAVHQVVGSGLATAARYGFTQRGPVRFYLELMLLLGSGFDTDPQLPRPMAEILCAGGIADQLVRADRLHGALLQHMRAVLGPGNRYARAAIERLRAMSSATLVLSADRLHDDVLRLFEQCYPERCALAEPAALSRLIAAARSLAATARLDQRRGTALCSLLMFELGHRCFDDPLFPWLSRALDDAVRADDPVARTERLEARAKTYLALVARRLERGSR